MQINIARLETDEVVAELSDQAVLASGNTYSGSRTFSTDRQSGGEYIVVLSTVTPQQVLEGARLAVLNVNQAPVAVAGAGQVVNVGDVLVLDGNGSTDPDGDALTYAWHFAAVAPDSVLTDQDLSGGFSVTPSFIPDAAGLYTVQLTVSDGELTSVDQLVVEALAVPTNEPPVAVAGEPRYALTGRRVLLNGSDSFDPDGDAITYAWSLEWELDAVPAGSALMDANVESRQTPQPSFIPDVDGTYRVQLIVNDGTEDSTPVVVTVIASGSNVPPNAHAGASQTVLINDTVNLDASDSVDPDEGPNTLSYQWRFDQLPADSVLQSADILNADQAAASFIPDVPGDYRLALVASDGAAANEAQVVITALVSDVPPNARAGADQKVAPGALVSLDGTGSWDPDNAPQALTYEWDIVFLPQRSALFSTDIANANQALAEFQPDVVGDYVLGLTVSDGQFSARDHILVSAVLPSVSDLVATAEMGSVRLGWTLQADAIGYDIYRRLEDGPCELIAQNYVTAHGDYLDTVGVHGETYCYYLRWMNAEGDLSPESNESCVQIVEFVADAGDDQTVDELAFVALDGSRSAVFGDYPSVDYQWTQVAGPVVNLDASDPIRPTFSAPSVLLGGETLTFQLTVGTGELQSDPDTVDVTVKNVNHVPVADAGNDQTVREGATVLLSASNSYDTDGDLLTYEWLQSFGPLVTLADVMQAETSFIAPSVDRAGATLTFDLTVSDGLAEATDSVDILVENVNHEPLADAGVDQTVDEGTGVLLDGSGSTDPDGDVLTYNWSQITGSSVDISGADTVSPSFLAPIVGPGGELLVFSLTVNDGDLSGTAETFVQVRDANDPPACDLGRPSVDTLWPPDHKLVEVAIENVGDPNNDQVTLNILTVEQDEPTNGLGDGDTSPDAVLQEGTVLLRAERAGTGNGRIYAIRFSAWDELGQTCNGEVRVCVPQSRKAECVFDGTWYDSTQP